MQCLAFPLLWNSVIWLLVSFTRSLDRAKGIEGLKLGEGKAERGSRFLSFTGVQSKGRESNYDHGFDGFVLSLWSFEFCEGFLVFVTLYFFGVSTTVLVTPYIGTTAWL